MPMPFENISRVDGGFRAVERTLEGPVEPGQEGRSRQRRCFIPKDQPPPRHRGGLMVIYDDGSEGHWCETRERASPHEPCSEFITLRKKLSFGRAPCVA